MNCTTRPQVPWPPLPRSATHILAVHVSHRSRRYIERRYRKRACLRYQVKYSSCAQLGADIHRTYTNDAYIISSLRVPLLFLSLFLALIERVQPNVRPYLFSILPLISL